MLLAVLWRLRYKLGFRDVAELLLQRGFEVSYETVRVWEFRFSPLVSENHRARRRGQADRPRYLGETYVKVSGRWCYLYGAFWRLEAVRFRGSGWSGEKHCRSTRTSRSGTFHVPGYPSHMCIQCNWCHPLLDTPRVFAETRTIENCAALQKM